MRTSDENKRAQIAYDVAYFVLPRRAYADIEELKSEFDDSPDLAAITYFSSAAKARGVAPLADDLRALRTHTGKLDARQDFIVIEYPRFPAVNLLESCNGGLPPHANTYVLAPYFSAIVEDRATREVQYFVLGQSADARTTLRLVSPAMNANLGPGCEPELNAFLELLRQRTAGG